MGSRIPERFILDASRAMVAPSATSHFTPVRELQTAIRYDNSERTWRVCSYRRINEDPVSVSHWMGHASVVITLQVYAHFMPDNGERGRTAVDSWLTAGRPAAAVDLRTVEPPGFTEVAALALPEGPAKLYVTGARYGGVWAVGVQLDEEGALLGELRTEASDDGDRALAAALAWVEGYSGRSGLSVVQAENLNAEFPAEVRPFQARGRFVLAPCEP
ncbi:hypothetical protein [Streptomyces tendae]